MRRRDHSAPSLALSLCVSQPVCLSLSQAAPSPEASLNTAHFLTCSCKQNDEGPEAADLKVDLTARELAQLVGNAQLVTLMDTPGFPTSFTTIKLRRCSAIGQCINFHTDFSECTMQIALNSPESYRGGELVYANSEGLHVPLRPVGSATIHGAGTTRPHIMDMLWVRIFELCCASLMLRDA